MDKKICFTIMGFGKKTDFSTGKTFDLDKTYFNIIKPTVEKLGYVSIRADEIQDSALIDKSMYALLVKADLVIADITTLNPNALYELGIRHAARANHTIILKDKDGKIPFDLDHNRFLIYTHLGDDVGATEALSCQNRLKDIINTIERLDTADSPLFEYLPNIKPHNLSQEDYEQVIAVLSQKEKHVFAISEQAKLLKSKGEFKDAAILWGNASKILPDEDYFIQQQALCTYKSELPSVALSLTNALSIISKIYVEDEINDPETLGLVGAIYKRMYLENSDIETLKSGINAYKRGFVVSKDSYAGENYATCLDLLSNITEDADEKVYSKFLAKQVRQEVVETISKKLLTDSADIDCKWLYASMANCYFHLGNKDEGNKYEKLFLDEGCSAWEEKTYFEHKPSE